MDVLIAALLADWGNGEDDEWKRILAMLTEVIKAYMYDHELLRKPWYYRNAVVDEMDERARDMLGVLKHAGVETWEMQSLGKCEVDPANAYAMLREVQQGRSEKPTYSQYGLNIIAVSWYLNVLWQLSQVQWTRVVPVPSLGSRPIILKAMLRDVYKSWKVAVLKKLEQVLMNVKIPDEVELKFATNRDVPPTDSDAHQNRNFLINYPDVRVNYERGVLTYPTKEVAGSGLVLAKVLGLGVPNPSDIFPHKYFQGTPGVGDIPLPGGFPSTFTEFTNEDIFWLVVSTTNHSRCNADAGIKRQQPSF